MAAPSGVIWDLLPHTATKHEILRLYLGAWFPILGIGTARELYYFDGFAGPGEYIGGELGSPLIALDAAVQVASRLPSTVHFAFSELDPARAQHLDQLLSARRYPTHFHIDVRSASPFEEVMTEYLEKLDTLVASPPMFVFIDPFGWKGFPMESSGPHHQDSGEAKIRESTAGVSRKPSSDCKACGCSSKHLCGLTAWNT